QCCGDRIGDGQGQQAGRGDILPGRNDYVREGLGTGIDERAGAGLAGMRGEGGGAAEQETGGLPGRVAAVEDGEAQQGAADRPDDRVDRVPGAVDPGDLVGEEFGERADAGGGDHPLVGEYVERLELVGQVDPAELHGQAGNETDQVQPPAGQQADRRGEGD